MIDNRGGYGYGAEEQPTDKKPKSLIRTPFGIADYGGDDCEYDPGGD